MKIDLVLRVAISHTNMLSPQEFSAVLARFTDSQDQQSLLDELMHYRRLYYEEEPVLTDGQYDKLEDLYEERFPEIEEVGAETIYEETLDLICVMKRPRKLRSDKDLDRWISKHVNEENELYITAKLDGHGAELRRIDGVSELISRGNGKDGRNRGINLYYLLPYVIPDQNLWNNFRGDIVIRGELVFPLKEFRELEHKYKDPRGIVTGMMGRNSHFYLLQHLTFIPFYVCHSTSKNEYHLSSKKTQDTLFKKLGFSSNQSCIWSPKINLAQVYMNMKTQSPFLMDGLVLYLNHSFTSPDEERHDNMVAFKFPEEFAETVVTDITWKASASLEYKPVLSFEPRELSGATLSAVTGNNYDYLVRNKLSIGAVIQVSRTGGATPTITSILRSGNGDYNLPQEGELIDGKLMASSFNPDAIASNLYIFTSRMGIKGVGKVALKKLTSIDVRTPWDMFTLDEDQLRDVMGKSVGSKLYNGLQQLRCQDAIDLISFLRASNYFPRLSEKKMQEYLSNVSSNYTIMDMMHTSEQSSESKSDKVWTEGLISLINAYEKDNIGLYFPEFSFQGKRFMWT